MADTKCHKGVGNLIDDIKKHATTVSLRTCRVVVQSRSGAVMEAARSADSASSRPERHKRHEQCRRPALRLLRKGRVSVAIQLDRERLGGSAWQVLVGLHGGHGVVTGWEGLSVYKY